MHDAHPDVVVVVDVVAQQENFLLYHAAGGVHRGVVEGQIGDMLLHRQKHLLQPMVPNALNYFVCHDAHSSLP
ncbi:hypothetical protein SDC9_89356 [bioreactor metagenome]|uniref:Uncharacterized protein n=1 Tax=bioreactor metagenome TaxID=1076179 RepID=A0A644ZPL7_9ZZZZ